MSFGFSETNGHVCQTDDPVTTFSFRWGEVASDYYIRRT